MFGSNPSGASAYAKVDVETGVVAASPHKLIVMLFEGAIQAVKNAAEGMKAGDIQSKGNAISKAIMIIDNGLRASLNKESGGKIAENLDALYEYMNRRLLLANLQNKPELLDEVLHLLQDIKGAWDEIGNTGVPAADKLPQAPAPAQATAGYDALAPRSTTFVSA